MVKKLVTCAACGSKRVTRFEQENFDKLTLGAEFSFTEIYYKCESCGEEGDFLAETDKNYLLAQKDAQIKLVQQILTDLNKAGVTMAMFERVFELPVRTLTRWKMGDFSSSAIALLRIAITYPWIIEVAEHRFESNFTKVAVIAEAAKALMASKMASEDSKIKGANVIYAGDKFDKKIEDPLYTAINNSSNQMMGG